MDERFYAEYKWSRSVGNTVQNAYDWACFMRSCDYDLFSEVDHDQ